MEQHYKLYFQTVHLHEKRLAKQLQENKNRRTKKNKIKALKRRDSRIGSWKEYYAIQSNNPNFTFNFYHCVMHTLSMYSHLFIDSKKKQQQQQTMLTRICLTISDAHWKFLYCFLVQYIFSFSYFLFNKNELNLFVYER